MTTTYDGRVEQARHSMERLGAAALVITYLPNVFYLCGFTGSNAALLVLPDSLHLFTDSRYTIQASQQALGARVHIGREPVGEQAGKYLRARNGKRAPHGRL